MSNASQEFKKIKKRTNHKARTRRKEEAVGYEHLPNVYDVVVIDGKRYYYVDRNKGPIYNSKHEIIGFVNQSSYNLEKRELVFITKN